MDPSREESLSESDDSEDEDYVPEGLNESSVTEPSEAEPEDDRQEAIRSKKKQTKKARGTAAPRRRRGVVLLAGEEASNSSSASESEEDSNSNQSSDAQETADRERNARAEEIWKSFKADAEISVIKKPSPAAKSDAASTVACSTETTTERADKMPAQSPASRNTANVALSGSKTLASKSSLESRLSMSGGSARLAAASLTPSSASVSLGGNKIPASESSLESRLSMSGGSARLAAVSLTPTATKRSSSALETMLTMVSGGKKSKLSTLEQSRQDWNSFTDRTGITDDLRHHNKDGFLEKRDFLERAEVRQWEMERELRMGKRR